MNDEQRSQTALKRKHPESGESKILGTAAAIDIGTNMIRMVIAQFGSEGQVDILERLQQAVHLGQDTFRMGRLGRRTMRAAILILRDFKQSMELYDVTHIRAVATSSVREAANADIFLDRVLISTGIEVNVIDTLEESRLSFSALAEQLEDQWGLLKKHTLIADVGGGSTVLTVLKDGQIAASQSLGLGSVRLKEVLAAGEYSTAGAVAMIRNETSSVLSAIEGAIALRKIQGFVALGSEARFAAELAGSATENANVRVIDKAAFEKLVDQCLSKSPEQLADKYDLSFADAETLNPALVAYRALFEITKAKEIIVSSISMRDGLLLEISRNLRGIEDRSLSDMILQSTWSLAEKYKIDIKHAENVSRLAVTLFDALSSEHSLGQRKRLMLEAAAILHEVGTYISGRAFHKHAYYIISHSEVFGLNQRQLELVAQIARYHRRSRPKQSHLEYMKLSRPERIVVSKLGSILRVADALDTSRTQQIKDFKCSFDQDSLNIQVETGSDMTLTRRALQAKSDMFKDTYGLRVNLEEV